MPDELIPTLPSEPPVSPSPWPVTRLDLVLQACKPDMPLESGDPRYVDFASLRQGVSIHTLEKELIALQNQGHFHHVCLSGHQGCGKSTELLSLKHWADTQGFLAVRTEVDEAYGMIALESSDLFLLTARTVEAAMEEFGQPLPQEKLEQVVQWFAEIVTRDELTTKSELGVEAGAQLGGMLPFSLGKLFAKFTAGIKASSSHATTTREKIRNYPDRLIELTNDLLKTANEILKANGKPCGLLVLFDNLDRYEPKIVDSALFRSSSLIERMECHAVFTMPISLEYDPLSGASQDCYGFPIILPMLALRHKPDRWADTVSESAFDLDAVAGMRGALARRIDIEKLFEKPEDADLLVKMSGGCIRDLMHLVTHAFRFTENSECFTSHAVERAIRTMRATYLRRLNTKDYTTLARIAHTKEATEEKSRLLFLRFALEYLDENHEPWIDVHPLVVDTQQFQDAYQNTGLLAQP